MAIDQQSPTFPVLQIGSCGGMGREDGFVSFPTGHRPVQAKDWGLGTPDIDYTYFTDEKLL